MTWLASPKTVRRTLCISETISHANSQAPSIYFQRVSLDRRADDSFLGALVCYLRVLS